MTRSDRAVFWLAAASFASMASMRVCDPMLPARASGFGQTSLTRFLNDMLTKHGLEAR